MQEKDILKVTKNFNGDWMKRVSEIIESIKDNKEDMSWKKLSPQHTYGGGSWNISRHCTSNHDKKALYFFRESLDILKEVRIFCPDCKESFQITSKERIQTAKEVQRIVREAEEKLLKPESFSKYYDYTIFMDDYNYYDYRRGGVGRRTLLSDLYESDLLVLKNASMYLEEVVESKFTTVFGEGIDYVETFVDGDCFKKSPVCPHCQESLDGDMIEMGRSTLKTKFEKMVIRHKNEKQMTAHFKFFLYRPVLNYPLTMSDKPRIIVERLTITNVFNLETGNVYNMAPQVFKRGKNINLKGYDLMCCNSIREEVRSHSYFGIVDIPSEVILEVGLCLENKFKELNPYIRPFEVFSNYLDGENYSLSDLYAYNKMPWGDLEQIKSIYPAKVYDVIRGVPPYVDNALSKTLKNQGVPNKKNIRKIISSNILSLAVLPYLKMFKDENNLAKLLKLSIVDEKVGVYEFDFGIGYSIFGNTSKRDSRSFLLMLIKKCKSETVAANKVVNGSDIFEDTIDLYSEVKKHQKGKKKKEHLTDFSFFGQMNLREIHDKLMYICTKIENENVEFKYDNSNIEKFKEKEFEGLSFLRTKDAHELIYYGDLMKICVGHAGYIRRMQDRKLDILFAVKNNKPVMCIEVSKSEVHQVKCYANMRPVGKDKEAVLDFIEHFGLKVSENNKDLEYNEEANAVIQAQGPDLPIAFMDNNDIDGYDDLPF